MSNIGSYSDRLSNFGWSLAEKEIGYQTGDPINIEFDQMIKAAVQAVELISASTGRVTEDMLAKAGWQ